MGDRALYWNVSDSKRTRMALQMVSISAYAAGTSISLPESYEDMVYALPEYDMVTPFVVQYVMLRENGMDATLSVENGSLTLTSGDSFISLNTGSDIDDGPVCDSSNLYQFSPLYRDIPDTVDSITEMFSPIIRDKESFMNIISEAVRPRPVSEGLNWGNYISSAMGVIEPGSVDSQSVYSSLMLSVGKYKLNRLSDILLSEYLCTQVYSQQK